MIKKEQSGMRSVLKDSFESFNRIVACRREEDRECFSSLSSFLYIFLYSLGEQPIYRLNSEEK